MTKIDRSLQRTVCRDEMIAQAYSRMYDSVSGFVAKRIGNQSDVEDIVQDVFEALLKPGLMLSEATIDRYIFSIARNCVIDYLRHHACCEKAQEYFFVHSPRTSQEADMRVCMNDVWCLENNALKKVGEKGKRVYVAFVHEGYNIGMIAKKMGLSKRTAENHLLRTRNKVRTAIKKAL